MQSTEESERKLAIGCYSENTKKPYLYHIQQFIDFCNGNPKQELIEDYLYFLKKEKNYKPSSLNLAKCACIYYFRKVRQEKIIVQLEQIRRGHKNPEYFTKEQIEKIREKITNKKHKALFEVTYGSGLREDEVLSLKWQDIDFERKVINVKGGKGNKDRITMVSERAIGYLRDWKKEQESCYKGDWIFSSLVRDYHICAKSFQNILKKACEKAGLNVRAFPHKLRHSFSTHLLNNGTDIRLIQKVLGHSSIRSTEIYTHVSNRDIMNIISPSDVPNKVVV